LYYDYHVIDMLKHHLPLADEIIVNEGFSKDGTYAAIKDIDPKIKIHRFEWDRTDANEWFLRFKNQARELCTGDWCILLDCDEFIPEWEFENIRRSIVTSSQDLIPFRYLNFYGNYKVNVRPSQSMMKWKMIMHRNRPDIEVWGDGANVRIRGEKLGDIDASSAPFICHHFGEVRKPARLRQKWNNASQSNRGHWQRFQFPAFLFNLFPHKWKDPDYLDKLEIYEGPYVKAVRDNPKEFVRDGFQLYEYLKSQQTGG
jgi:glycosyltransferase involved in cell wall biosynthesis